VLSTQATTGDMRIDAVARVLAVTPRTLQRRLAKVGTSFETLRDDARRQAAETYLSDPDAVDHRSDVSAGIFGADRVPSCVQAVAPRRYPADVPSETVASAENWQFHTNVKEHAWKAILASITKRN
jgi:AraC-like DNA-binding protein